MTTPLTWREHFLTHALAGTIDALDSALEDRDCESKYGGDCNPDAGEPCWRCRLAEEHEIAVRVIEAVHESTGDITYKVWVQVERIAISPERNAFENIGLPDIEA